MKNAVFSVSGLNQHIKELLESDPVMGRISVRGELSNYKVYPSGHHYFTLKDNQSTIRCVMFKSSASRLRFLPENGLGVICAGNVSVYPRDGAYQLYVQSIIPEGVGDLQLAFDQLKSRLYAEGLFNTENKKPLPAFPQRIAVITSGAGAAVRDIIRILGERWPLAEVLVIPVKVQGEDASREIALAIRLANKYRLSDLIITGRGGGSMEDLWAFNEEIVAREIFASAIPVISAVGHEPDVTISDFVADMRASTPSNGAEIAVPDMNEVIERLNSFRRTLDACMKKCLNKANLRLDTVKSRRLFQVPRVYFERKHFDVNRIEERMLAAENSIIQRKMGLFQKYCGMLDSLSPLHVLSRGYCYTIKDETMIRSVRYIDNGDIIKVFFEDGSANCIVKEVNFVKNRENR